MCPCNTLYFFIFFFYFLIPGSTDPERGEPKTMIDKSELKETTETGMEVYLSEVHSCLAQYMEDRGIEDMEKESQNKWSAAMRYVGQHVFKGTQKLKEAPAIVHEGFPGLANNNAYDLDKVNALTDYYINLCYEYDKEVSMNGFSFISCIPLDVLTVWSGVYTDGYQKNIRKTGEKGASIIRKVRANNEESLSGMLISGGKRSPVGILGALNRKHGWNMGQPIEIQRNGLPNRTAADIAEEHRIASTEVPELPDLDEN